MQNLIALIKNKWILRRLEPLGEYLESSVLYEARVLVYRK